MTVRDLSKGDQFTVLIGREIWKQTGRGLMKTRIDPGERGTVFSITDDGHKLVVVGSFLLRFGTGQNQFSAPHETLFENPWAEIAPVR